METIKKHIENLKLEIEIAIKEVNRERKANKNSWYLLRVTLSGHIVNVKGFGTWIQIMESDLEGIRRSSSMGMSVKDFSNYLEANFQSIQEYKKAV